MRLSEAAALNSSPKSLTSKCSDRWLSVQHQQEEFDPIDYTTQTHFGAISKLGRETVSTPSGSA